MIEVRPIASHADFSFSSLLFKFIKNHRKFKKLVVSCS
jgi:hypothetical protein